MIIYELADYINKDGQINAKSVATIIKQQYDEICNCFSFVDFYHTCKCLKKNGFGKWIYLREILTVIEDTKKNL